MWYYPEWWGHYLCGCQPCVTITIIQKSQPSSSPYQNLSSVNFGTTSVISTSLATKSVRQLHVLTIVRPHYAGILCLHICLLAKIYSLPPPSPFRGAHGSFTDTRACAEKYSHTLPAEAELVSNSLSTSILFMIQLVPRFPHFCVFCGSFCCLRCGANVWS